jgi:glycine hydroxymethyltransferase
MYNNLQTDKQIYDVLKLETERQQAKLELIASENFVSPAVLEAAGTVLTNKYAEGYPGKRYYGGCEFVDMAEDIARDRLKEIYGAEYANVQPHSGSQANMAVLMTLMKPGDKFLGLSLPHGGHLTHGSSVNFSGKLYKPVGYELNKETRLLDYNIIEDLAKKENPKVIIAGASAYSREWDYKALRGIADSVGAFLMCDMAHPAGLIAKGLMDNPIPYCDVVTSTTHKTLRGPRGGIILMKEDRENPWGLTPPKKDRIKMMSELYDSTVMPGIQGGPLMHIIMAKAVAFGEVLADSFKTYAEQVIKNAKTLADELMKYDFDVVSGGTDNQIAIEKAGITVNKNMVPFDTKSPFVTSGIRVGTPAVTTRGMKETEMKRIAEIINSAIINYEDDSKLESLQQEVKVLCSGFPLYKELA